MIEVYRSNGIHGDPVETGKSRWVETVCVNCGGGFVAVAEASTTMSCGKQKCITESEDFRSFKPAKKTSSRLNEVIAGFTSTFNDHDDIELARSTALRPHDKANALFTSSGSYLLNPYIYEDRPAAGTGVDSVAAVAQPVVRLKSAPSAESGSIRSFVNLSLVKYDTKQETHDEGIEHMLDWLSSEGLYIPDFTFVRKDGLEDWGLGRFACETLRILYRGLELGVANYSPQLPTERGISVGYSDISVGAERVAWALTKDQEITPTISPPDYKTQYDIGSIDAHRTLVLGSLSKSCSPSDSTHQGAKMRKIAKELAVPQKPVDYELVSEYVAFWRTLIGEEVGKTATAVFQDINQVVRYLR